MGQFFKIFPKFEPILAQFFFFFKLEKSGDFAQNLTQNWADWYMNGYFFLNNCIFMGLLSNTTVARPYQNQTWVPPGKKGQSDCHLPQLFKTPSLPLDIWLHSNGMMKCGWSSQASTCMCCTHLSFFFYCWEHHHLMCGTNNFQFTLCDCLAVMKHDWPNYTMHFIAHTHRLCVFIWVCKFLKAPSVDMSHTHFSTFNIYITSQGNRQEQSMLSRQMMMSWDGM